MKTKVSVGSNGTLDMNIVSVKVLDRPVQATIVSANYGVISEDISKNETLVHKPGDRMMGVWHSNQNIVVHRAEKTIRSMTMIVEEEVYKGRPANIEELASYEEMFFETLGDISLVALGEVILIGEHNTFATYRSICNSTRVLSLLGCALIGSHFHLLIVFEKVSEPE